MLWCRNPGLHHFTLTIEACAIPRHRGYSTLAPVTNSRIHSPLSPGMASSHLRTSALVRRLAVRKTWPGPYSSRLDTIYSAFPIFCCARRPAPVRAGRARGRAPFKFYLLFSRALGPWALGLAPQPADPKVKPYRAPRTTISMGGYPISHGMPMWSTPHAKLYRALRTTQRRAPDLLLVR